jgi:hypothetical protein
MPQTGFKPAIPMFERQKTVRASDQWYSTFSPRTPRDTSTLNFVPPKLLVQDFILE